MISVCRLPWRTSLECSLVRPRPFYVIYYYLIAPHSAGRLDSSIPRSKRLLSDDRSNILVYMTGEHMYHVTEA